MIAVLHRILTFLASPVQSSPWFQPMEKPRVREQFAQIGIFLKSSPATYIPAEGRNACAGLGGAEVRARAGCLTCKYCGEQRAATGEQRAVITQRWMCIHQQAAGRPPASHTSHRERVVNSFLKPPHFHGNRLRRNKARHSSLQSTVTRCCWRGLESSGEE